MRFVCGVSDETALRLLKWSEFFLMFMLIIPVAVLLYQDKGITLGDFFLIQGLFRIAAFALEIPSGYVSDIFSRRKVLFIGALIWLAGNVGLYFAYGFWQIALCEMSFGFAAALFSGTKEAYAYDLLKRMKREKQFLQENGSIATYASTASFTATIAGGILYPVLGNGIIAVETVAALLAVICTFLLPELKEVRRKIAPESSPMQDVAKIVKMSVKHPEINLFMLFPALFGAFTIVLLWILQPTMEDAGVAVALFGFFVGLNQFSRILFSKFAHSAYERLGIRKILFLSVAAVVTAVAAVYGALLVKNMAFVYLCCAVIAVVAAMQKMYALVFSSLIHHRTASSERGTVISVSSMYATMIQGGMLMLMKPLLDGWGIYWTMLVTLLLFATIWYPLRKILKIEGI